MQHPRNVSDCVLSHSQPLLNISWKLIYSFPRNVSDRNTAAPSLRSVKQFSQRWSCQAICFYIILSRSGILWVERNRYFMPKRRYVRSYTVSLFHAEGHGRLLYLIIGSRHSGSFDGRSQNAAVLMFIYISVMHVPYKYSIVSLMNWNLIQYSKQRQRQGTNT